MLIMNCTSFWTARERSLAVFGARRNTHRLSFKERDRRMDFVRNKLVNDLMQAFMKATMVSMKKGILVPEKSIRYSRGKLKVNGIAIAAENIIKNKEFGFYRHLFAIYWKLYIPLRMVIRQLRYLRKVFGPNILSVKAIKPTRFFLREILCRMVTGKPSWRLSPGRREGLLKALEGRDDIIWNLLGKHPFGGILLNWLRNFRKLRDFVRDNRGDVILWALWKGDLSQILALLPNLNLELLGDRPLSKRQQARLRGRKIKMEKVILWQLLFDTPAVVKEVFLTPSLVLVISFSLQGLFVYVKDVSISVKEDGNVRYKFRSPALVQTYSGLPKWKTPKIQASLMPGRLLQIREYLINPKRFERVLNLTPLQKFFRDIGMF